VRRPLATPKPKKRKNGRSKGKRGENQVAKLLEPWWGQFEPGVKFKSTPQSGGWASPEVRAHFKTAGDLVTTGEAFPFTVEVKYREAYSEKTYEAGKACPVWGWWQQAIDQAREENGVPMLWFRKNHKPWTVLVPEEFVYRLPLRPNQIRHWKEFQVKVDVVPVAFLASDLLQCDPAKI
jgi:hypothetical protein